MTSLHYLKLVMLFGTIFSALFILLLLAQSRALSTLNLIPVLLSTQGVSVVSGVNGTLSRITSGHSEMIEKTDTINGDPLTVNFVGLKLRDADFNFTLPFTGSYNISSFRESQWFLSLLSFASQSDPSEPIITVCVDASFKEALLNWLIAVLVRQPHPPKNILVVTDAVEICSFVRHHRLPVGCIQVSVYALLNVTSKKVRKQKLSRLLLIRMSVMRILNHFGYHVLNLDADAILLKNIFPILEQYGDSDIIGTSAEGGFPRNLVKKWGTAVNFGAVLIRSTPATEFLWRTMAQIRKIFDDQVLLNLGLNASAVSWTRVGNSNSSLSSSEHDIAWVGHTPAGLKVVLLSQGVACRSIRCDEESVAEVYIWHHGKTKHTFEGMNQRAWQDGVWFLRQDWEKEEGQGGSGSGGVEWLSRLALPQPPSSGT